MDFWSNPDVLIVQVCQEIKTKAIIRLVKCSTITSFTVPFSELLLEKCASDRGKHINSPLEHVCFHSSTFFWKPATLSYRLTLFVSLPCRNIFNSLSLLNMSARYSSWDSQVVFSKHVDKADSCSDRKEAASTRNSQSGLDLIKLITLMASSRIP